MSPFRIGVLVFFAAAALVVGWTALDWGATSMHAEVFRAELKHLEGRHFQPQLGPLWRFFDCIPAADECGRPRHLSFLFFYLNSPFRFWLASHVGQHPSASLNWIFGFGSLIFVYLLIKSLTENRVAALISTALYMLSAGFLSTIVALFNPAKPQSHFFIALSLYLAALIFERDQRRAIWALLLALMLGFLSDEAAYFVPLAIFILFPASWLQRRNWPMVAAIVGTFGLFLLFAFFVGPAIVELVYGHQDVSLVDRILNRGVRADPGRVVPLSAYGLWRVIETMVHSQFGAYHIGFGLPSILALCAALGAALAVAQTDDRRLIIRAMAALMLFAIYHAALISQQHSIGGTFYYGSAFAIFAAIVTGAAIHAVRHVRFAAPAVLAVAIYFGFLSYTWFVGANRGFIADHDRLFASEISKHAVEFAKHKLELPDGTKPSQAWLFIEQRWITREH